MPRICPISIKSSALPKISLTRGSPRKWTFQEDKYIHFVKNDAVSNFNYITKEDCTARYSFKRYDDHIALRRQITKELHIPKVSECIRITHELYVKLFLTRSPVPLPQWFRYG